MVWVHLVKEFGHSCLKMIIFVDDGTRVYGLVHFDVALPAGGVVGCAHARTARCGAVVRARATRGGTRAGARGDRRRRGGAAELGHTSASLPAAAAPLALPPPARACAWGARVRRAGTSGRARPLRRAQAARSRARDRASRCSRRGNAGGLARRADGGGRAQKAAPPRRAREWAAPRARAAPPRASGRRRRTPGNVAPRVRCRRRLVGRAPRPHVPRTQSVEGLPAATARGPV